ncbi:UDP-glucose 4-epimerase GalE [Polynucleobacter paneuropaeus]|nr:UDP-glucose 4-epimerase GalE [Polynucleobacter paneuropaeus]MBT8605279.1 UDP-glucose 4-epimerase GalE [Polynucleobacter paneuropaeus]MBT8609363.1 UDP-glucose 4-epimerase GalE [Polynucleobacter paneuropaeus]
MNILLTGGAGYIGSHTAVALSTAGFTPVIYDNFCNSSKSVIERLEKIIGKPLVVIEGDVRDTQKLTQTLVEHEIDSVIHFAGLKAVGESVSMPLEYYANNIQGTISLMQAMQQIGVKNLVFSSSATVYGDPQYLPIDESHPLRVTNPYGRSKLHIEEILHDLSISDESWRILCLRYFNPAGAHESGMIGENPNGIPNNLMPFIGQVAAGQLAELQVFGGDYKTVDGTGVRDFIHVMDLAEGHLAALEFIGSTKPLRWDAVNLGTGQGYSVLQMVSAFSQASCKEIPYQIVGRREGDIASCYASVGKAKEKLNWQAKRGLENICTSGWSWQTFNRDVLLSK